MPKFLPIDPIKQGNDTDWCWAACHTMAINFKKYPHPLLKMCNLVQHLRKDIQGFAHANCCGTPNSEFCRRSSATSDEMTRVLHDNGVDAEYHDTVILEAELKDEIDHNRPVEVSINWRKEDPDDPNEDPGSHVLLARGWTDSVNPDTGVTSIYFVLNDPWRYPEMGNHPSLSKYIHYIVYSELLEYRHEADWAETWARIE